MCDFIFDLDGTLIDSSQGIATSLAAAFLSVGRVIPVNNLRNIIGPPISLIARHLDPSLSDPEVADISRHFRSDYDAEGWRQSFAFAGVSLTLQKLQEQGARLFIITNKPRHPTEKILVQLDLRARFEQVLSRDSRDPAYTSKAEMLSDLLARRNLDALSTRMVGDTAEDEDAAAANGLKFIHARYGYGTIESGSPAIDALPQLLTLLDRPFDKDIGISK